VTNRSGAPVESPTCAAVPGACCSGQPPASGRLWLSLAALLFALLPEPALAVIYSCADASGRVVLRDVPCKQNETSREPGRPARTAKAASAEGGTTRRWERITQAQVQELVDGMDAATTRHDVDAMLGYLAVDVVVEIEYRLPQGLQFKRFNKEEYAAQLRGGTELSSTPDYRRDSTQIVLAPNAHYAELTSALRQTIRVQGEPLPAVTRSKSMVELRDGRAQITLLRTVTTFDVPTKTGGAEQRKGAAAK
jgi:hypothetical protein